MMRECKTHGYFRGEICPQCGDEGKFLLSDEELERVTRIIAGCLRHFPQRYGLKLDSNGWVLVDALVDAIVKKVPRFRFLRPFHIQAIADTDDKGRYDVKDGLVRATYGHTLNVILDLPTDGIPEKLFYPVPKVKTDQTLAEGIQPVRRNKVHLSGSIEACVNAGVSIKEEIEVIEVDAEAMQKDGIKIMRAGKVVYLTDEVPASYLKRSKKGIKRMVDAAREEREKYMAQRKKFVRIENPKPQEPPPPKEAFPQSGEPVPPEDQDDEPKWDFP